MNLYVFTVKYQEEKPITRNIQASTYTAALNLLYFPHIDSPEYISLTPDESQLIALRHGQNWVGDYGLNNPSTFDRFESSL